jgi:hypothetical protein
VSTSHSVQSSSARRYWTGGQRPRGATNPLALEGRVSGVENVMQSHPISIWLLAGENQNLVENRDQQRAQPEKGHAVSAMYVSAKRTSLVLGDEIKCTGISRSVVRVRNVGTSDCNCNIRKHKQNWLWTEASLPHGNSISEHWLRAGSVSATHTFAHA